MKTITVGSFFVLFVMVAGLSVATPVAFADHSEVVIEPVPGSGMAGCQDEGGCYNPMVATVDVGGVVIFSNTDNVAHTFTAGTPTDGPSGVFDSGLAIPDSSFEYKADMVGEVPHFCIVHPWMTGTIIVQEADADSHMEDDHKDDHADEHADDEMYMDGMKADAQATGMLSDGTMVKIWTSEPTEGEMLEVTIKFKDEEGMMKEHVNYDLMVMQNDEEVLNDMGAHKHEGKGMHTTAPLGSSDPVDITVTFQGFGVDTKTGPVGEMVAFTNIVPEFGTIAMMVLVVAIIGVIAVTAKSRVIPRL